MLRPYFDVHLAEAGCDEAGRGCLAGPVFAAAVILPKDFFHPLLNDSKQLSGVVRNELRSIIEREAVAWAVASVDEKEIDRINILQASLLAMHHALHRLSVTPDLILVDGNRFRKYKHIPHQCIIKGDSLYASIAAASILAKTHRDEYMMRLHKKYPDYGWDRNKGYPTPFHRRQIVLHGSCRHHRHSFRLIKQEPDDLNALSCFRPG